MIMSSELIGPIINKESPCKKCNERHEACHARCEKYLEWKGILERNNHERWKEEQRYSISDTKRKWLIRNARKK